MSEQASALPQLLRPVVLRANLKEFSEQLTFFAPDVKFDRIIGRNALMREEDKSAIVKNLARLMTEEGVIVLAESIPRRVQRLYRLLEPIVLGKDLYERLIEAEEAIYQSKEDPMVNWDVEDLQVAFEGAGLTVKLEVQPMTTSMVVTPSLLERWFPTSQSSTTSYAARLSQKLGNEEVAAVKEALARYLNQTINWSSIVAYVHGRLLI